MCVKEREMIISSSGGWEGEEDGGMEGGDKDQQ